MFIPKLYNLGFAAVEGAIQIITHCLKEFRLSERKLVCECCLYREWTL